MTSHRTIIIGGGVAGLGTALGLGRKGGFAPLVLEAESEVGGLARSLHFKGVSTDLGPHRLHTELPEVYELVSEICGPSLITVQRASRIYLRGRFLKYPPSPLEVAMHLGPLRMMHFGVSMVAAMIAPAPAPREETYDSLMRRSFGPALYEFMLRPYSAKTWKTDPAEIHADTARVRVSAGSLGKIIKGALGMGSKKPGQEAALEKFRYVKGGVETLVRHLRESAEAKGAEVRVSSPVEKIELEPTGEGRFRATGVRLRGVEGPDAGPGAGASGALITGDSFVSTAPLPVLLNDLLPPLPELAEAREAARGLAYIDMIFVNLIVRRKVISGDNWLYFPDPEFVFNRAYEAKNMDPAMGPEDKSVICIELTTRPGADLALETDEAITARVIDQMTGTGLFAKDEIEDTLVYRLAYGYPIYSLDYHDRLDVIFAGLRRIENLLTSGRQGLFNHNNTDHSIFMGLRSADAIAADPEQPAKAWYDTVEQFKHFRIVD